MKKGYVYKVCKDGRVYGDLQTAVKGAIGYMGHLENRISEPKIVKRQGGYIVVVVGYSGAIYRANIDVFKPAVVKGGKVFAVDECHAEMKKHNDMYHQALENESRKSADEDDEDDDMYDIVVEDEEDDEDDEIEEDEEDYDDEDEDDEDDEDSYCAYCGQYIDKANDEYHYDNDGDIMCAECKKIHCEVNEDAPCDGDDWDYEKDGCDGCEYYDKENDCCDR